MNILLDENLDWRLRRDLTDRGYWPSRGLAPHISSAARVIAVAGSVTFCRRRRLSIEMNGPELLAAYKSRRSEDAFTELVRSYTNLVYSVAKRHLPEGALAEEATQTVFLRLVTADQQWGQG